MNGHPFPAPCKLINRTTAVTTTVRVSSVGGDGALRYASTASCSSSLGSCDLQVADRNCSVLLREAPCCHSQECGWYGLPTAVVVAAAFSPPQSLGFRLHEAGPSVLPVLRAGVAAAEHACVEPAPPCLCRTRATCAMATATHRGFHCAVGACHPSNIVLQPCEPPWLMRDTLMDDVALQWQGSYRCAVCKLQLPLPPQEGGQGLCAALPEAAFSGTCCCSNAGRGSSMQPWKALLQQQSARKSHLPNGHITPQPANTSRAALRPQHVNSGRSGFSGTCCRSTPCRAPACSLASLAATQVPENAPAVVPRLLCAPDERGAGPHLLQRPSNAPLPLPLACTATTKLAKATICEGYHLLPTCQMDKSHPKVCGRRLKHCAWLLGSRLGSHRRLLNFGPPHPHSFYTACAGGRARAPCGQASLAPARGGGSSLDAAHLNGPVCVQCRSCLLMCNQSGGAGATITSTA